MRRILALTAMVLVTTGGVWVGVERGNRLYRAGRYAEAVAEYRDALRDGEDSPSLRYNLGTALLQLGRYDEAQQHFETALAGVDPELRQYVHYNLGQRFLEDARARQDAAPGLYDAAVEAYRQALRLRPDDLDAKWNYELALREREQAMQQQGGGGGGEQPDESEPQDNPNQGGSSEPNEDGEQEQERRPQAGQQPLTPEQAERILSGVEQDERELFRDKLRQGPPPRRTVRDW